MYHALYRKYRPVDFDSVVGQDSIIRTLRNSIINNNISHAYMFFGPRGTGKTTVSKVFARNINCLNPKDGNACKECDACKFSFSKECVDIIEIDAASNNGVNEIRELKNNINLVPSELKYKVYIVDEVHMLSDAAFNALLKTLEEPPEHVVFILATTDPQKVPETIVSRCQCFSFKRISDQIIEDRLKYVCKQEKIDIEDVVLNKIAILSDGGLRDALGALDKLVSYSNNRITLDDFNEINGVVSDNAIDKFLCDVFAGNIKDVLNFIAESNNLGKNLIQIMIQTIDFGRNSIVDYYLKNKSLSYSLEILQNFINVLNEKMFDLKRSSNTKVYIEMLILNFINEFVLANSNPVDKIINTSNSNSEYFTNSDNKSPDNLIDNKTVIKIEEPSEFKNEIVKNMDIDSNNVIDSASFSSDIPKILNISEVIDVRINNTFATADKNLLKLELSNFDLLKDYSFDQQIGYLVNSLLDSNLCAVGTKNIILSYDSEAIVEQNLVNIVKLNDVYNKITNSNKNIAIVSKERWNELKKEFISKKEKNIGYQILDEPELLLEESSKDDIITSSAVSLFGEDIVEVE